MLIKQIMILFPGINSANRSERSDSSETKMADEGRVQVRDSSHSKSNMLTYMGCFLCF